MPDLIRHPKPIEFYIIPSFAKMTGKRKIQLFTKPSNLNNFEGEPNE
jgi:hypothetical protein